MAAEKFVSIAAWQAQIQYCEEVINQIDTLTPEIRAGRMEEPNAFETWPEQREEAIALIGELNRQISERIKAVEAKISIEDNERKREWAKWTEHPNVQPQYIDGKVMSWYCIVDATSSPDECFCDWR